MSNELTAQENLFLSLLFSVDETTGCCVHPEMAKVQAGYAQTVPLTSIIRKLNKEIVARGDDFLAVHSPIALRGLLAVLNDPTEPGAKIRLQAATELLDRAGIVKKEKQEQIQQAPNYIFVLPNKKPIEE